MNENHNELSTIRLKLAKGFYEDYAAKWLRRLQISYWDSPCLTNLLREYPVKDEASYNKGTSAVVEIGKTFGIELLNQDDPWLVIQITKRYLQSFESRSIQPISTTKY